ncbi:hypothetical protein ACFQ1T_04170 [Methylophilus glucosoxydans]|uniref:Uncharacterized protein n=1 Tax=Methylophilus glucosoxydans TaxID=752553 RepID=A0ABW3GFH9_9PROT
MFSLIESKSEIEQAQKYLEATFNFGLEREVTRNIGYPGGTTRGDVRTDEKYWFYSNDFYNKKVKKSRRLNWLGKYKTTPGLNITVEINVPHEGRDDRVAGFFARHNITGEIYLFHSGRVGGGKRGVGKSAFIAWSNQRPIEAWDSKGKCREGLLVMPIKGEAALEAAIRYVDLIVAFKKAVRNGEMDTNEFKQRLYALESYYAESRGLRKGLRSAEFEYITRHADVVDALNTWRKENSKLPKDARITKNILIDLGVAIDQNLIEVYEVKMSTARQHIYAAIGQLMVHGKNPDCKRIIVLPEGKAIASDINDAFKRMNIDLKRFRLTSTSAVII